jgi:hypothetical protein
MPGPILSKPENSPSFLHTLLSGGIGGALGGFTWFPPEGLKKRIQSGTLTKTAFLPRELYRGSAPFATAVMVNSTACMTLDATIKRLPFYDPSNKSMALTSAVASGMMGALLGSTPVENIILTQQLHKLNPMQAVRHMLKQGALRPWAGAPELMIREAGFSSVMLFAGPAANKFAMEKTNNPNIAFGAELAAGIFGAILTHPADTQATYRQKLDGRISFRDASKQIFREAGLRGFFKGVAPRVILFVGCATTIPRYAEWVSSGLTKIRDSSATW